MSFPRPPAAARAALDALVASDPDLAGIEARAGPLPWRTRTPGFGGLLQAIVAQQISNQAAANQSAQLKFASDGVTHVVVFEANGGNRNTR